MTLDNGFCESEWRLPGLISDADPRMLDKEVVGGILRTRVVGFMRSDVAQNLSP